MAPRLNRMALIIFQNTEWFMYYGYLNQLCKEYKNINVIKYIAFLVNT